MFWHDASRPSLPPPPPPLPLARSLSPRTFPLTLLHIVEAVKWQRAAAVTTHPQPLQWQTHRQKKKPLSQWLVKKGKEHFAFALTIKPWQRSGMWIFLRFQFSLLLFLEACVNKLLHLWNHGPVGNSVTQVMSAAHHWPTDLTFRCKHKFAWQ